MDYDLPFEFYLGSSEDLYQALYITLDCLYGLLLCLIIFQLGRIFVNRHKLASFQFLFLVLCFFWTLMRTILLTALVIWRDQGIPASVFLPLAWIPLNFQFATYTLFVMFYAHVVYRSLWEDYYKVRFFSVWAVINGLFLFTNIIWIILACTSKINLTSRTALFLRYVFPSVMFFALVVLLCYYGYKLYRVLQNPLALVPFRANGSSLCGIAFITVLLNVVFSCRAVYCAIIAYEALAYDFFVGEQPVFRFLSLLISEVVPTFAILIFFRHIPKTKTGPQRVLPPAFYNSVNGDQSERVSFFSSPFRYESDDEGISSSLYTPPFRNVGIQQPNSMMSGDSYLASSQVSNVGSSSLAKQNFIGSM